MTPFFSIIIPVYNVAPYLRECLDSVLAQTFTDWEAICVDDGSTDGSGDVLDEYAAKDKRFRVIHQKNAGVGAARNKGLDIANGNWILFLDSDDVWQHNLLSTVVSMTKAYPGERLYCFNLDYFKDVFSSSQGCSAGDDYTVIDISKNISMDRLFSFFICYAYRRDLFDGIRFPGYIRGEDQWLIDKILLERVNVVVSTDSKLYGYRCRPGSAMNSTPSLLALQDEMDYRLEIMEMIDNSPKVAKYAGNKWLEGYFTQSLYQIACSRTDDKAEVMQLWQKGLCRAVICNGLSKHGRFVAWLCIHLNINLLNLCMCYIVPRLLEGGSAISFLKRRFLRRQKTTL